MDDCIDDRTTECPDCRGKVEITYTKPPGYKSEKTKTVDHVVTEQLKAFKLTDHINSPSRRHEPTNNGPWGWQNVGKKRSAVDFKKLGLRTDIPAKPEHTKAAFTKSLPPAKYRIIGRG